MNFSVNWFSVGFALANLRLCQLLNFLLFHGCRNASHGNTAPYHEDHRNAFIPSVVMFNKSASKHARGRQPVLSQV
jgi:hypothetical protein